MYSPDKWVVLKMKGEKGLLYKILGGWSGGYLQGQSWRINSGITKVSEEGDYYLFEGYSGSVYKCHKNCYGTNLISAGILSNILSDPKTKDLVSLMPEDSDFKNLLV